MKRTILASFLTLWLGACSVFGYNTGVNEPPYNTVIKDDSFELREYPSIVMVTAFAEGSFNEAQNTSFNRLFDYISGDNEGGRDIPMTAPVVMESRGREIPMTAPVLMENSGNGWAMSFILPADMTLENAPQPSDKSLTLSEQKNVRFAAVHFHGFFNDSNFDEQTENLKQWMDSKNLKAKGPALRAGYNPPWTLPPLRRNEVLIPVE